MATVVIAMCILKQALLAKAFISPLKRLDWAQPASVPFTMMKCTVISTWNPTRDRSYIILRSVIRFPIRASQHPMSHRKSHWQAEQGRIDRGRANFPKSRFRKVPLAEPSGLVNLLKMRHLGSLILRESFGL